MVLHPSLNFDIARQPHHAPARELAQRVSGTDEILLLWHPEGDWVEVSVCDITSGVGFSVDVAPADAMDAFTHPYAYAAKREVGLEVAASLDG
jgi:hypothetical protein